MNDIIIDTLIDGLKLFPFLFLTFLLIEYVEHRVNNQKLISTSGKYGPLIGSLLGAFPQCGFSVSATNLFATRIITIGTLISVYLSTSDEMLPILISEGANISIIIGIIVLKIIIGMISGFLIDFFLRWERKSETIEIESLCKHDHCHCEDGILKSSLIHTINILVFIVLISFLLNLGMTYLGEETLSKFFMKGHLFGPFIAGLIGLIPNCASSVVLTELYLHHTISFASAIAGLLSGSGIGLLVLFKTNKNMKENFFILFILYGIGVITGIIIELINIML